MTASKEVQLAHETHEQLVALIAISKRNFVALGHLLGEIKKNDRYRNAVGEGIDTWIDYISQPEISLTKGDADRLIQIYEIFVEQYGFSQDYVSSIPVKNLHYLLPVVKKADEDFDIDSVMEDARNLSQKDFKERIHDIKDDSGNRTYEYMVMQKCIETGNLRKVHGIESNSIKEYYGLE